MRGSRRLLKKRQVEILELVALDLSNQEIAEHLKIEVTTVNNHLNNIYNHLGVNGRAGAVFQAIVQNIIDPIALADSYSSFSASEN